MTKPFLLSTAIHILILGVIFIWSFSDKAESGYVETVTIRIRNRSLRSGSSAGILAASPSESSRNIRKTASIPQLSEPAVIFDSQNTVPSVSYTRDKQENAPLMDLNSSIIPLPGVDDAIRSQSLAAVDPLAGFENILPGLGNSSTDSSDSWSLAWANGSQRGILSEPAINPEDYPQETERLQDILVLIKVSPQGDVLSAEVVPPGSGDIRIDRRIHNAALQLVLEPWPEENGVQEGRLRLLFQDGNQ